MKQKYTLSIADVELNVAVDESPETVEYIVGVIDRKMRDILLHSKYCPKTQAALLCALDLCAEKLKTREEADALEDEIAELNEKLKAADEKYARAQSLTTALEREKAKLEIENIRLKTMLDDARSTGKVPEYTPNTDAAEESSQNISEAAEETPKEKKLQKGSRVGSMFDLLTFGDI